MTTETANIVTDDELISYSYKRAAELLDISYSQVRKLVYTGKLKAFPATPRRPRIRRKVLLEYIEKLERRDI